MENPSPVILEISSDEEACFGETREGGWDEEDNDWLSKLLDEVERNVNDSDDAVFVRDSISKPKESNLPSKPKTKNADCEDADCVILDGDPDKLLAVEDGRVNNDDSDDLVVIGEKGQVACRDFPHPRHLCAKFLFASTPHERRCDQCHCYVCDSLAPCALWGTGISSLDHCHATEKEEFWRAQRKSVKQSDNVPPVLHGVHNTSFSRGLSQTTPVLPSTPLQPNSLLQNQSTRQVTARPCSMSTSYIVPNIINLGRSQPPGFAVPRNRFQPHLVAQQLHNTSNSNGTLSARNYSVGTRGPRFIHPRAVFKRSGYFGASVNNGCGYNKSNYGPTISSDPFLKSWPASLIPGPNSYNSSYQPSMGSHAANSVYPRSEVSVPPNMGGGFYSNYTPSQPQMSFQPYSSYPITNSMLSQPQMSSQPFPVSNSVTEMPSQSQVASQSNVGSNIENSILSQSQLVFQPNGPAPLQTLVSNQPNAGSGFQNHFHSQSLISSQPNMVKAYEYPSPSLPKAHSYPTILSNDAQNIFQQGNQTESGFNTSITDFGCNWDACLSRCNHQQLPAVSSQHQHPAPTDNYQHQSVTTEDDSHHQSGPQEDDCRQQFVAPADNSSLTDDIGSPFPGNTNRNSLDFHFDNWMSENQSSLGALEVAVPRGFNVFSPE
ncbi:uncharacterized protein Fot_41417 [Forsythia ovata]|uniref:Uncharacterized protein n=1 Tax=Forsythia ovata TaxID=205694 RepID=A0ABD1RI85_9LAMI